MHDSLLEIYDPIHLYQSHLFRWVDLSETKFSNSMKNNVQDANWNLFEHPISSVSAFFINAYNITHLRNDDYATISIFWSTQFYLLSTSEKSKPLYMLEFQLISLLTASLFQ